MRKAVAFSAGGDGGSGLLEQSKSRGTLSGRHHPPQKRSTRLNTLRYVRQWKRPRRHLRRRGTIHQGVGHASMVEEIPFVGRSMEYEGIVHQIHSRQFLCVHHQSERFNPLTYRGGNTRRRSRPYSETSCDHGGGNSGKQSGLAHLSLPSNPADSSGRLMRSGMPDPGFE